MPNNLNLLQNGAADMDSDTWFDRFESLFSKINYLISGGLVIGDFMNYLNQYASAFGVILGFLTLMLQLYFGIKRQCAYVRSLGLKK